MSLSFAPHEETATPLHVLSQDALPNWLESASDATRKWVASSAFAGKLGQGLAVPDADGGVAMALIGYGTKARRMRARFHLAAAMGKLPPGTYNITSGLPQADADTEALGWLLGQYRFDRYARVPASGQSLRAPSGVDAARLTAIAEGEALTRNLINTPAADMGPPDLEEAARALAARNGARIRVITGDDLLAQNYPLIHTVGRAAAHPPRLIDIVWGDAGPAITLVGKGVCFDTGGLNLKPGASMGLMKKDMGGAANVLGLAHMIMALALPIRLRVLIPAVENAVDSNAFRPGDILTSRKGLTVEINNTDAEGRLVLADALTLAQEEAPDHIISMATLTGAARVAVGPDLAPYYTTDTAFAARLDAAAQDQADPVWRLPFHDPYESMIEPGIADLDNAPKGGFAGSITAALFLRRFVDTARYTHFDIYGWQPSDAPARPKGGVGQGTRALLACLAEQAL
ncbi:MAG: leucyl aminopeptidase family protein [Pseudomonadota bacterium]